MGAEPGSPNYNTQGPYKIVPPQPPQIHDPTNPINFVSSLATKPVETISAILNPVRDIVIKDDSPSAKVAQFYIGMGGEMLNEYAGVQKAVVNIGQKPIVSTPSIAPPITMPNPSLSQPYTPKTNTEQLGSTFYKVGTAVEVAVVAPIIAPEIGISKGSVLLGEALGAGLNQVPNVVKASQGQPVSPTDVVVSGVQGAAEGGVFSIVGGKAIHAVGLEGKTGLVPVAGRIAVNTGLGGGAGAIGEYVETGKSTGQGFVQGAAFGFAFGLGGEVVGSVGGRINAKYNVAERIVDTVPIVKYGSVKVPLTANIEGEELSMVHSPTWRGLYVSRGSEAKPLVGKQSYVPEGYNIDSGYVPKSNIESSVTLTVMKETGYEPKTLQAIQDVRQVMHTTQYTPPKNIDDVFPLQTKTLSQQGTATVKEFILTNKNDVQMVYGSYATKPQLNKSFEFTKDGASALREPGDIDIQLTTDQKGAEKFAADLVGKLQVKGEAVRISPEKPTLIEADVGSKDFSSPETVHHAVDIHFKGETTTDVTNPVAEGAWGYTFAKKPVTIEKVPAMALNEQGLRKGASIMGFTEEHTIGPKSWRNKDIPDFFQAQKTLLDTMPKTKTAQAYESFERAKNYYGVTDAKAANVPKKDFVYYPSTKASPYSSLGITYRFYGEQSKNEKSPSRSPNRDTSPSPYIVDSPTRSKRQFNYSPAHGSPDAFISVPIVSVKHTPQSVPPKSYGRSTSYWSMPNYSPSSSSPKSSGGGEYNSPYDLPSSPSSPNRSPPNESPPSYSPSTYNPSPSTYSPPPYNSPSPYPSPPKNSSNPLYVNPYYPYLGNQYSSNGFSNFAKPKHGVTSHRFVNPILEGFELFGAEIKSPRDERSLW